MVKRRGCVYCKRPVLMRVRDRSPVSVRTRGERDEIGQSSQPNADSLNQTDFVKGLDSRLRCRREPSAGSGCCPLYVVTMSTNSVGIRATHEQPEHRETQTIGNSRGA